MRGDLLDFKITGVRGKTKTAFGNGNDVQVLLLSSLPAMPHQFHHKIQVAPAKV